MANSLQEQLLKAGLISEQQVKDTRRQDGRARRQDKKPPKKARPPQSSTPAVVAGTAPKNERERELARQRAAKIARDRALNQDRDAERGRKAKHAQARQLLEQHSQNAAGGESPYNYLRGRKVKRAYVHPEQRERIIGGQLVLAVVEGNHHLLLPDIAARVAALLPEAYLHQHVSEPEIELDQDDPYADFKVPDDLVW